MVHCNRYPAVVSCVSSLHSGHRGRRRRVVVVVVVVTDQGGDGGVDRQTPTEASQAKNERRPGTLTPKHTHRSKNPYVRLSG